MTKLQTITKTASIHDQIRIDTTTTITINKTIKTNDGRIPNLLAGKLVQKHNTGANIIIFQNTYGSGYNNMVKQRLGKEKKDGDCFQLSERVWGIRRKDSPIVDHKNTEYLEVIFIAPGDSNYTVDGEAITYSDLRQYLPPKTIEGKQGGLSNKVIIRTFKADSITKLTIGSKTYTSIDLV